MKLPYIGQKLIHPNWGLIEVSTVYRTADRTLRFECKSTTKSGDPIIIDGSMESYVLWLPEKEVDQLSALGQKLNHPKYGNRTIVGIHGDKPNRLIYHCRDDESGRIVELSVEEVISWVADDDDIKDNMFLGGEAPHSPPHPYEEDW